MKIRETLRSDITPQDAVDVLIEPGALEALSNDHLDHIIKAGQHAQIIKGLRTNAGNIIGYRNIPAILSSRPRVNQELINELNLEESYNNALDTQKTFALLRPGDLVPDFNQIMEIFTLEMLKAAKTFQAPQIVLIPPNITFNDIIVAINGHKIMHGQSNTNLNELFERQANLKTANWQAHIIEGPSKLVIENFYGLFNHYYRNLKQRMKPFRNYKKRNKISGMDRFKYMQLMMDGLKKGVPIDCGDFWTILDEDMALSISYVPIAAWNANRKNIELDFCIPEHRLPEAYFRRSVGNNVLF